MRQYTCQIYDEQEKPAGTLTFKARNFRDADITIDEFAEQHPGYTATILASVKLGCCSLGNIVQEEQS